MLAIGRYTQKQWGKAQREKYLSQLVDRFETLAEQPYSGKACDEIKLGYRKALEGRHVIFYRVASDGVVEVVRVLHMRMDIRLHL